MAGVIIGLDLVEAMASIPTDCDQDFARELLIIAEAEFMAAMAERAAQEQPRKPEDNDEHG